jgi:hypothetical protein
MKVYMGRYPKDHNKERKIEVRIDNYDLWGLDETLALIITPALKKLKEIKQGAPFVDDDDVPDELKSTSTLPKENDWDTDSNHFKRWDWVLDEMIFAFESHSMDWEDQFWSGESDFQFLKEDIDTSNMTEEQLSEVKKIFPDLKHTQIIKGPNDTLVHDREGSEKYSNRMANGRRLFAKYYNGLWN